MHVLPLTPARLAYTLSVLIIARYTVRYLLCIGLRERGFLVHEAGTDRDGLHLLDLHAPHAVIFEPATEHEALRFVREVRQKSQVPLLLMSTSSSVDLRAAALDHGADDFIPASMHVTEVMARLRAILRRSNWTPDETAVGSGYLTLDPATRTVCVCGQDVHLTAVETRLMNLLLSNPGQVVTYQQFLTSTWGQATKKELSLLRTHMYQLRSKLEAPSNGEVRIVTEPQVGYRLKLNGIPDLLGDELPE